MGRFTPTEPAGLLARSYYELLENKQPILGNWLFSIIHKKLEDKSQLFKNIVHVDIVCDISIFFSTVQVAAPHA